LKEFKEVLVHTPQDTGQMPKWIVVPHAGHYPMEEKPYVIADLLCNFVIDSSSL
jgi:pimeloyl-ACP methyl ester carboxylesterase